MWTKLVKNHFQLQKRLENDPKISNFLKFSIDLKNVSRHCGGPYNIKNEHFEHFLGAVSAPPPCHVGLRLKHMMMHRVAWKYRMMHGVVWLILTILVLPLRNLVYVYWQTTQIQCSGWKIRFYSTFLIVGHIDCCIVVAGLCTFDYHHSQQSAINNINTHKFINWNENLLT